MYEINTQIMLPDNVIMKDDDEVEETSEAIVNFFHDYNDRRKWPAQVSVEGKDPFGRL